MIEVSLIIPTHNRSECLAVALESAGWQDLAPALHEIIVVDNASRDDTAGVVERIQTQSRSRNLRFISEEQLGLHHARHAGARAAKGRILVFTDDDATFDPKWLGAYAMAFTEHPEMVAAAGPIRPMWEEPLPEWLKVFIGDYETFPIFSLMERPGGFRVDPNGVFFGVNMAIRRDALFAAGGFNPEAFGDMWLGNGETGLNHKLRENKLLIGYVPDALVYHHIPRQRLTVGYLCHRMANEGACDTYARFRKDIPNRIGLLRYAGGILFKYGGTWLRALSIAGRKDPRSLAIQLESARTRSRFWYTLRLIGDKKLQAMVLKDRWL